MILLLFYTYISLAFTEIDYLEAGDFILEQIQSGVSVERLDRIEDSLFILPPRKYEDLAYRSAFNTYFLFRSFNKKYIRSAQNQDMQIGKKNRLKYLINEADEIDDPELTQLAKILTYEHEITSGNPEGLKSLEILCHTISNPVLNNICSETYETYKWRNDLKIPDFSLTSIQGEKINLTDIQEPYILLDFWFVGCAPCEADIPILKEINEKYGTRLKVLSINFEDDREKVSKWVEKKGVSWPFIIQDESSKAYEYFKMEVYPQYHIITNDLQIVATDIELEQIDNYLKQ